MPALDALMKRFGFVKLTRYGLVLTPEGRIMSLRPAVLDDGLGGRIVGWREGDLAAMELQQWEPARPAPNAAVATRVAVSAAVAPVVITVATPAPVAAPMPRVVTIPGKQVAVAAEPQVDEDDWEWEIALARARVATEDAAPIARPLPLTAAPRRRADTVPPPVTRSQPMPTVAAQLEDAWPTTEPLGTITYEEQASPRPIARPPMKREPARSAPKPVLATGTRPHPVPTSAPVVTPAPAAPPASTAPASTGARPQPRPGTAPVTVIPIPKLPSVKSTRTTQLQPVVKSPARITQAVPVVPPVRATPPIARMPQAGTMPTPIPPAAPRRFPRGTQPVTPTTTRTGIPTPRREEDAPGIAAVGDQTTPGLALPPVARTVTLPSIKRLAR